MSIPNETVDTHPAASAAVRVVSAVSSSVWFRAVVSASLLTAVLLRVDWSRAREQIAPGRWYFFALAVAVQFAAWWLAALRWRRYLGAADVETTTVEAFRAYVSGTFATNFLPSLGADAVRAYMVSGRGSRIAAGTSVVVDRITAVASLIVLAALAAAAHPAGIPVTLFAALAAAGASVAVLILAAAAVFAGRRRFSRYATRRVHTWGRASAAALRAMVRREVMIATTALGLVFQGLVVLSLWLVGRSLGLALGYALLATVAPVVLLLSAVPISIGGFGVREWTFVALLGQVGVNSTDALVFSLASALAAAISSLPGAVVLATYRARGASLPS